tara:strand:- start:605 stop:766 length:162 start_codon:yes stop_codon:yes gene_type:complete
MYRILSETIEKALLEISNFKKGRFVVDRNRIDEAALKYNLSAAYLKKIVRSRL